MDLLCRNVLEQPYRFYFGTFFYVEIRVFSPKLNKYFWSKFVELEVDNFGKQIGINSFKSYPVRSYQRLRINVPFFKAKMNFYSKLLLKSKRGRYFFSKTRFRSVKDVEITVGNNNNNSCQN